MSSTQPHHSGPGSSIEDISDSLSVQPGTITLGPDETYQLGNADAAGTAATIRWSISEPGCSESDCGIVYDNGLFRAPHLLPRERVVFLVGVPKTQPRLYVIREQIRLVPRNAVASTPRETPLPRTTKMPVPASDHSGGDNSAGVTSAPSGAALSSASRAEPVPVVADPIVTYKNGLLTIDAEDATLAAVLQLVAEKTGAAINIPPGTGSERIAAHSGPGEPREILKDFLNGSPFGFIIVNSPEHPHGLQQVLLFVKNPGGDFQPTNAAATMPDAADSQNQVLDSATPELNPQRRPVPPAVIERMMRAKAREIRQREEAAQPQAPPSQ